MTQKNSTNSTGGSPAPESNIHGIGHGADSTGEHSQLLDKLRRSVEESVRAYSPSAANKEKEKPATESNKAVNDMLVGFSVTTDTDKA